MVNVFNIRRNVFIYTTKNVRTSIKVRLFLLLMWNSFTELQTHGIFLPFFFLKFCTWKISVFQEDWQAKSKNFKFKNGPSWSSMLKETFMVFGDYWIFMKALFVKVGIVSASDGWVCLITREKAQNRGIWHNEREKINSSKYKNQRFNTQSFCAPLLFDIPSYPRLLPLNGRQCLFINILYLLTHWKVSTLDRYNTSKNPSGSIY